MEQKVKNSGRETQFENSYTVYFFCLSYMLLIMLLDLYIPLGVAVGVLYVVAVLVSLWAPEKKFTLFVTVLSSCLTVWAYCYKPAVSDMWKVVFNRAISLLAIWTTSFIGLQRKVVEESRERAVREREQAMEDVKVLRGLLPICSSCKRIKDEKGYWKRIEGYIRDHSEADFTHSLCEECAVKLYPQLFNGK